MQDFNDVDIYSYKGILDLIKNNKDIQEFFKSLSNPDINLNLSDLKNELEEIIPEFKTKENEVQDILNYIFQFLLEIREIIIHEQCDEISDFPDEIISDIIPKILIKKLLEEDKKKYDAYFNKLHQLHEEAIKDIESFIFLDPLILKNDKRKLYWEKVYLIYGYCCFFPDEKIRGFLTKIKINESSLCWFVEIKKIVESVNLILDGKSIVFFKSIALDSINVFLQSRIMAEINFVSGYYLKEYNGMVNVPEIYVEVKNKLKRNQGVLNSENKIANFLQNTLINRRRMFNKTNGVPIKNSILSYFKGNPTKNVFSELLLRSLLFTNSKSENIVYREFFDLLKPLIEVSSDYIQGYKLLSESEFLDCGKYYGTSYDVYKSKKIREILTRGDLF